MMTTSQVMDLLRQVLHPGMDDRSIVDLGMVQDVSVTEGKVSVTISFPRQRDPLAEYITGSVRAVLYRNMPAGTGVEVKTVAAKENAQKKTSAKLSLDQLNNVAHIIGIASGKGGVGKSTVAVNLAVALARLGYRVGLADADIYGPSIPIMTQTEGEMPEALESEDGGELELIIPIEKYGVKWMSIGYFAQAGQAIIWRGPMACSALKQMILQVRWGVLDFLLIDMPPGTGDIHISLVQDIPMEGVVIVTTPQGVALSDVEKGVDMFRNDSIHKRIFGLVENMAWFTPAELPDNRYYIFGKDGGVKMSERFGIPLLGQIPLVQGIRESGDRGEPCALSSGPDAIAFMSLAEALVGEMEKAGE